MGRRQRNALPGALPAICACGNTAGFGRDGRKSGAGYRPHQITGTALHTWGLDRRENAKPDLILRADGQQNVTRCRAPSRSPLCASPPLGSPGLP